MILVHILGIIGLAAILAWIGGKINQKLPAIISYIALAFSLELVIANWHCPCQANARGWLLEFNEPWMSSFGINFHFAADGLSMVMISLTLVLGILAVFLSRKEIVHRKGFFHMNLLSIIFGIIGIFTAIDLFLFYFFWETILLPIFLILIVWGTGERSKIAIRFFLYTQLSGLLMLLAIITLYLIHGKQTSIYTFDLDALKGMTISKPLSYVLLSGFMIAFMVKLGIVPFHSWLPDTTESSPIGVNITGLLIKTGAFASLRFVLPIFPDALRDLAPYYMVIGAISIFYGAKLAYAQTNLKRIIAYSGISHAGFILLGIFAMNEIAFKGIALQMVAPALATTGLFIIAQALFARTNNYEISAFGGLWAKIPIIAGSGLLFLMATVGVPGMGNFNAEFLTILGIFKTSTLFGVISAIGIVAATVYTLRIMQKLFYGTSHNTEEMKNFSVKEIIVIAFLIISLFWLGLFPQRVINWSTPAVDRSLQYVKVNS